MDHQDHMHLLEQGIPSRGGFWADLGSGRGAFTLALIDLIGPAGFIYSIDRDEHTINRQAELVREHAPQAEVHYLLADFNDLHDLPPLDGIVMANSLHFQPDQEHTAELVYGYLKPDGRLLVVEYNIQRKNFAVPYPLPFDRLVWLARRAGFRSTQLLVTRPSRSLDEIYSACSIK